MAKAILVMTEGEPNHDYTSLMGLIYSMGGPQAVLVFLMFTTPEEQDAIFEETRMTVEQLMTDARREIQAPNN